jgi:hypothetical protein
MTDEMVEYCESFRPELDLLRAFPKGLVDEIEGKVIEDYPLIVRNRIHRTLPKTYRTFRTRRARLAHCALLMDGWQHRAAFVIQFRADANIEAGLFEGKVEHVATCQSIRFHSLDELLAFMAVVLAQVRDAQEV